MPECEAEPDAELEAEATWEDEEDMFEGDLGRSKGLESGFGQAEARTR